GPTGTLTSSLVVTLTMAIMGVEEFIAWGWRLPFLISIVLLIVGIVVRAKVSESPEFLRASQRPAPKSIPIIATLRKQPVTLLFSVGLVLSPFLLHGLSTTYPVANAFQIGVERQPFLTGLSVASFSAISGILGWSRLSEATGRRPLVISGALLIAVW